MTATQRVSHVMIHESELLGALDDVQVCGDCAGGRGVHIDLSTGDYEGVVVHSIPCAGTTKPRTLRLVDADSHRRCRYCGALLLLDIGGANDGEVEAVSRCPNCDPRPGAHDSWGRL